MNPEKLNKEIPKGKLTAVIVILIIAGAIFGGWFVMQTIETANAVKNAGDSIEANR